MTQMNQTTQMTIKLQVSEPDLPSPPSQPARPAISPYRRYLYPAKQASIVFIAIAVMVWFAHAILAGLAKNGIGFDMGFVSQPANFDISEGVLISVDGVRKFVSSDSNGQALLVGLLNTLKISLLAIVTATVLGVVLGVARLSNHWLVRQLSFFLVEFVRNTPMLIQLVFWYFAVMLRLPAITEATQWIHGFIFSQQGFYFPGLIMMEKASGVAILTLVAGIGLILKALCGGKFGWLWAALSVMVLTFTSAIGFPLQWSFPSVTGFSVVNGYSLSPEFLALLLGLSVYTAAFLAEIVRGAILSLPRGQWEAAAALGLPRSATFREVLMPQVARVVLPAFGNQYISLAKSTSLGIAIGFSDLFNVYGTVANQSGRSLEGMIIVMLTYLLVSWLISALVNTLNHRLLHQGGTR
jgi:general L-amino acid transport system permease protein